MPRYRQRMFQFWKATQSGVNPRRGMHPKL